MPDEIIAQENEIESLCYLVVGLQVFDVALRLGEVGDIGGDGIPRRALGELLAKRRWVERFGDMLGADRITDAVNSLMIHDALQRLSTVERAATQWRLSFR